MNWFRVLSWLFNPWIYRLIQSYRVTDEALMPEEYRYPTGRYLHDDWAIFKSVRRRECAYRVPLPYRGKSGSFHTEWMLFDPAYPLSPGVETKTVDGLLYVLTDRADYGFNSYEAFINGEWRVVFWKYTGIWFGKRLSWYYGLHQDNHVSAPTATRGIRSDLMCWFPETAASWVKEV